METLMLPFSPRFIVLTICAVVTALLLGIGIVDHKAFDLVLVPLVIFGALTLLGIRDLTQKSHAVLRNYPLSAHLRFLLEKNSARKSAGPSSKTRSTACPFQPGQARGGLSACEECPSISGPLARNTTFMPTATSGCATPLLPRPPRYRAVQGHDRRS